MLGKPRKLSIPPIQRVILWALEEAGSETIICVLNTLRHELKVPADQAMLRAAEEAVRELIRSGYVAVARVQGDLHPEWVPIVGEALKEILDFSGNYQLALDGNWISIASADEAIELILTDQGWCVLSSL